MTSLMRAGAASGTDEGGWGTPAERAVLNILEDFHEERVRAADSQRAVLNVLDDFSTERARTAETHRAVLNILDDLTAEKERLELTQRAVVNLLEDFDVEKGKVEKVNVQLRSEVSERERTEQVLQRRTEELSSSNAELEVFAYVASHDLSEPLRAISGPIALIARRYEGRLDAEADQFIGFAVDGCKRMQTIINDLLAYSRVGRVEGGFGPVDCNRLIEHVLAGLRRAIEETRAKISVGELPTVQADVTQLGQVFQNLIANALKFVGSGVEPHIDVAGDRCGDGWRFTVTDNGIGIEPQHRERIFGMFKRLHGRDDYPGTGIGLALAKRIVERHGGAIGVDAAPGGGTRFWFTLRVEAQEIAEQAVEEQEDVTS